jgi:hypothetical protein
VTVAYPANCRFRHRKSVPFARLKRRVCTAGCGDSEQGFWHTQLGPRGESNLGQAQTYSLPITWADSRRGSGADFPQADFWPGKTPGRPESAP